MWTRREFGAMALGGLVRLKPDPAENVRGVRLGVQTYSFRALPRTGEGDAIEPVIRAMRACGLDECELYAPQVEPAGKSRDDLRAWRLTTPLDHFRGIRQKFDAAGIRVYAYNYSPNASYSDEEIDRGFAVGEALGAEILTSSTTLDGSDKVRTSYPSWVRKVSMYSQIAGSSSTIRILSLASCFGMYPPRPNWVFS